jgi:hypothetical protein
MTTQTKTEQKVITVEKIVKFVKENKVFFIVFGALFSYYLVWWLAFYPGTLSPDSISHWQEAQSFKFTNASPYLYSLILGLLSKILPSPSVMGLFQLTVFSGIIGATMNYFYKKGISLKLITLTTALYVILPVFAIYNVTIWKDVLYSYIVLAFMLGTYLFYIEDSLRDNLKYIVFLGTLMAFVPLLRFNGIIFFAAPFILFVTKKLDLKKSATLLQPVVLFICFSQLSFLQCFMLFNRP